MLAPCVAVVGPANSGKTSLLNLLDPALQLHPSHPLVYVVQGSPDGTGRYQMHSPELRRSLKASVKGRWIHSTPAQICEWVDYAREHLDLVLLDFGGQHSEENPGILRHCSHYIALAREFDDPVEEAQNGMDSWRRVCEECELAPVAWIHSHKEGPAAVQPAADGPLRATFNGDAGAPGDRTNAVVIDALVVRLLALPQPSRQSPYIDLRLGRDWSTSDLGTLGELLPVIKRRAIEAGPVTFGGGRTPIWAYLAAMHRALDVNPQAAVQIFDPKTLSGLVGIPALGAKDGEFPREDLQVTWSGCTSASHGHPSGYHPLSLQITTGDRMLSGAASLHLASAPLPDPAAPPGAKVVVCGRAPIWIHAAYSRWLRSARGVTSIAVWDGGLKTDVVVHSAS